MINDHMIIYYFSSQKDVCMKVNSNPSLKSITTGESEKNVGRLADCGIALSHPIIVK